MNPEAERNIPFKDFIKTNQEIPPAEAIAMLRQFHGDQAEQVLSGIPELNDPSTTTVAFVCPESPRMMILKGYAKRRWNNQAFWDYVLDLNTGQIIEKQFRERYKPGFRSRHMTKITTRLRNADIRKEKSNFFNDLPEDVKAYALSQWEDAANNDYDEIAEWGYLDYRLLGGKIDSFDFKDNWNVIFQEDVTEEVIPNLIKEYQAKNGADAIMPVLIPGSGMALANDQLRHNPVFGKQIRVTGTNLESARQALRRKDFWKAAKSGTWRMPEENRKIIVDEAGEKLNSQDYMFRHILMVPKSRKFNLIVDVQGDITKSSNVDPGDKPEKNVLFQKTFDAAVALLDSPGRLYIGGLHYAREVRDYVQKVCDGSAGLVVEYRNVDFKTNPKGINYEGTQSCCVITRK